MASHFGRGRGSPLLVPEAFARILRRIVLWHEEFVTIRHNPDPGRGIVVREIQLSEDLGEAMVGINADEIELIMEERGR